jgi:tetratricopeptide (TPR) repeat protein
LNRSFCVVILCRCHANDPIFDRILVEPILLPKKSKRYTRALPLLYILTGVLLHHQIDTLQSFGQLLYQLVALYFIHNEIDSTPFDEIVNANATTLDSTIYISSPLATSLPFSTLATTFAIIIGLPLSYKLLSRLPPTTFFLSSFSKHSSPDFDRRQSRSVSPLIDIDPTSIFSTRTSITEGIEFYHRGQLLLAVDRFTRAVATNGSPFDRARASEWLGRTRYRIARCTGEMGMFKSSLAAFRRSIRLDSSRRGSITARASEGRVLFRMGCYEEAIKIFSTTLRRRDDDDDDDLAFVYEFWGKSILCWEAERLRSGIDGPLMKEAEGLLLRSIELDSTSYSTMAFLGEFYHSQGRTLEAQMLLERAVALRRDYPAALTRLAFIAKERLDEEKARGYLIEAISYRDKGGIRDDCLFRTQSALDSSTIYLSLYFATLSTTTTTSAPNSASKGGFTTTTTVPPFGPFSTRISILTEATTLYPSESLLTILFAINLRQSRSREERDRGTALLKLVEGEFAKFNYHNDDDNVTVMVGLGEGDKCTLDEDDAIENEEEAESIERRGLYALVLLGLGKHEQAIEIYESFWKLLSSSSTSTLSAAAAGGGGGGGGKKESLITARGGFLMMAFFELKQEGKLPRAR